MPKREQCVQKHLVTSHDLLQFAIHVIQVQGNQEAIGRNHKRFIQLLRRLLGRLWNRDTSQPGWQIVKSPPMYVPPHVYSIEQMTPAMARIWPATSCCNWCGNAPTYFIWCRIPPGSIKDFELACAEHAREASKQTGLGLEG